MVRIFVALALLAAVNALRGIWRPRSECATRLCAASPGDLVSALRAPSDAIIDAVDKAPGRRLAASDAAALAGVDLDRARTELMTLASLTQGEMDVTNSGEIIYSFDGDFRRVLKRRSPALRARRLWQAVAPPLYYCIRVSFATALFASLALIATTALAATASGGGGSGSSSSSNSRSSSSSRSRRSGDDDDGGNRRSSADREWQRSSSSSFITFNGYSPFDILRFYRFSASDGYYESQRREKRFASLVEEYSQDNSESGPGVSGIESFFSFVFGDGNPNDRFPQAQLLAAAEKIRSNGGIVIAEDLAPILDPPAIENDESPIINESWVLPAVISLGGKPMVSENGNIFYAFEDLTISAHAADANTPPPPTAGAELQLYEQQTPFSRASSGMKFFAAMLGCVNFAGVVWLSASLRSPDFLRRVALSPLLMRLYPGLAAYAMIYGLTPIARAILLARKNNQVFQRNEYRKAWAQAKHSAQTREKRQDVLNTALKIGLVDSIKKNDQSKVEIFFTTSKDKK